MMRRLQADARCKLFQRLSPFLFGRFCCERNATERPAVAMALIVVEQRATQCAHGGDLQIDYLRS